MTHEIEFIKKYGEVLGCGKTAMICGKGDVAAKIYVEGFDKAEIFHEAYLMALVEQSGLPVPKVYGVEQCCGRHVLLMSRARGKSLYSIIFSGEKTPEEYMDQLVAMQLQMHGSPADPSVFPEKRLMFQKNITYNPLLSEEEKKKMLARLRTMPTGNSLCHGDFHVGNVQTDGETCIILDWAEVSSGPAAADACRTYLDYKYLGKALLTPEQADYLAELFLEKYTKASGISCEEILAWLPINAAAICGFVQDDEMNKELYALATREE